MADTLGMATQLAGNAIRFGWYSGVNWLLNREARRLGSRPRSSPTRPVPSDAELMAATIRCAAPLRDYAGAIERMRGFAERYPGRRDLIGSALRVRILAHQGLDQFKQAGRAVKPYLQRVRIRY